MHRRCGTCHDQFVGLRGSACFGHEKQLQEVVKVMNRKSDAENLYNTVTADCETCSTKSTCGDDDGSGDLAASIDPNEKVGPLG